MTIRTEGAIAVGIADGGSEGYQEMGADQADHGDQ